MSKSWNLLRAGVSGILFGFVSVVSANTEEAVTPYPTLDRVEFVLGCMDVRGGQTYTTMYGCVCLIDKIADSVPYEAFLDANTLQVMMKTPGERGGAFRDAPGARKLTRSYDEVVAESERKCFVK
ncbi:MAG: hypothetical protein KTR18_14320 [Acidiferrobacterales bacterium]|nr:hypothetical protein [Acidiferrobacterales bacterium]